MFKNLDVHNIFISLYIMSQITLFIYNYITLLNDRNYSGIFNIIGHGLLLAKSSAIVLNFDFMLLFLLINKGIIYKLLGPYSEYVSLNEYINIHMYIVNSIGLFSSIHTGAHIYNFMKLGNTSNLFFTTAAGITGIVLVISCIIVFTIAYIRKLINYNIFFYTHMLYFLIVVSLIFHGSFCFIKTDNGNCTAANFYKWVIVPFALFVVEKLLLFYFSRKSTTFVNIKKHSNNINEIELYKENFQSKEGEWILVNCPRISKLEWHPFTITSNPVEFGKVSFHVKEQGDWTNKLILCLLNEQNQNDKNNLLNISYPYGTRQETFTRYPVTVLIAGGIGITAFMSLLQQLGCSMGHGRGNVRVKNVHLYWMCRSTQDFLAFLPRLQMINRDLQSEHRETPLHINLYLTGPSSVQPFYPPFTFNLGRPDFDSIFEDIRTTYKDIQVKILFCGSKSMNNSLYSKCKKWNNNKSTNFIYQKGEIFN